MESRLFRDFLSLEGKKKKKERKEKAGKKKTRSLEFSYRSRASRDCRKSIDISRICSARLRE